LARCRKAEKFAPTFKRSNRRGFKKPFDWGPGCHLKSFKFKAGFLSLLLALCRKVCSDVQTVAVLKNGDIDEIDFGFQLDFKKPF
jgi:hypothetical protein